MAKKSTKKPPAKKVVKGAGKEVKGGDATALHIAIVLDRSGSMDAVRDETIAGFNEQVQTIRKKAAERDGRTTVSLMLFNDTVVTPLKLEPASRLREITREDYAPDCCTAMLDAVGQTMLMFDKEVEDDAEQDYLVIIISDGMENASREFDAGHIAKMIRKRQATERWTFSYMGANQDLSDVSAQMGIPKSNMASYNASAGGTMVMFQSMSVALGERMLRLNRSHTNFVSDDEEIEDLKE